MPVYEYQCGACGVCSSHLLNAHGDEAPTCSACGSRKLSRLVSRFSRGRSEPERTGEAAERLATASDAGTGQALAEVGKAYDEDLSATMTAVYESDQEGV